jgi:uncharacterized protein YicC (UPF0701 family)
MSTNQYDEIDEILEPLRSFAERNAHSVTYEMSGDIEQDLEDDTAEVNKMVTRAKSQLIKLMNGQRVDEGEQIKKIYAEWYNKISKEHGVQQEVPHTAFHQIIKERQSALKAQGGSDE